MRLAALLQAVLAVTSPPAPSDPVDGLSAPQKARVLVISGLPAPRGVAGVLVRPWDTDAPRPRGALVFVDQEGGDVRAFPDRPPQLPAAAYGSGRAALAAGKRTGRALDAEGVDVDLAPVVDLTGGPLGSRHYPSTRAALAFARGLEAGGTAACPKHFPGLGSAAVSTDDAPRVRARLLRPELSAFRAAVRDGVRCVMVSHALYARFGGRALTSPAAYRLLRRVGFRGVSVTDSLSVVRGPWPVRWARRAARAGADLLLFTSPLDARRASRALVPLARRGLLDDQVRRVVRLRRALGFAGIPRW